MDNLKDEFEISSDEEHEKALEQLNELMRKDDPADDEQVTKLANAIEKYETDRYPM